MKKNFLINQGIELTVDAQCYDLHNFYDVISIIMNESEGLIINFSPSDGFEKNRSSLCLKFSDIEHLSYHLDMASVSTLDIDEAGYKSSDDDDLEWLKSEEQSDINDHLVIRFMKEDYIRVYASKAELILAG